MRLLSVVNSLGGSGGAEHGLVREVSRFKTTSAQMVVRLFEKDHLEPRLKAVGIDVEALGLRAEQAGYNWPIATRRLRRLIEAFRPDVVQSSLFAANLVAQLATRRSRVPVLSTFTLSGERELLRAYQPGAATWRGEALRRLASYAAQSDHVTFRGLTRETVDTNCDLLRINRDRAVVIPRGVPESRDFDSSEDRADLPLPTNLPLVLNVGRQTAQKGHLHLLRSFALVLKEARAHLAIVGREGDASHQLDRAVSDLALDASVLFVGYSSNVPAYLRQAKVFAFSSLMEGMPNAVLEAMAVGVPVVAFDIPPVVEVTDGGRLATLVEVGDESALAKGIVRVLGGDETILEKAVAAQGWVRAHYSIDAVAERVEARLREVAGLE